MEPLRGRRLAPPHVRTLALTGPVHWITPWRFGAKMGPPGLAVRSYPRKGDQLEEVLRQARHHYLATPSVGPLLMLVVFDTNVFYGDVHADRSRLRSILDSAAEEELFEVLVPEVVMQELDKQYPRRAKKVIKAVNKALGEHSTELQELGLEGPTPMSRDDYNAETYRASLETRLTKAGTRVLSVPGDLSPAVPWAVRRRKPFKETGEGFPDAAIWLTVLELAGSTGDEIVFVSNNTNDFGDGQEPVGLGPDLQQDLVDRGRPRDQVRLVPGIGPFADEVAIRRDAADTLARELVESRRLDDAIEKALLWLSVDKAAMDLGVDLDDDPQITALDIDELHFEGAAELPGERLVIHAKAEASVLVDLYIFKPDYYAIEDNEGLLFSVSDPDWNDQFLEAQAEVTLDVDLEITADAGLSDVEVEAVAVVLAPIEIVSRALHGRRRAELFEVIRSELPSWPIESYAPEARIESDIDEVHTTSVVRGGDVRLVELIETEGDTHVCQLEVRVEADVEWVSSAPSSFDADHFSSLALGGDAPILQDVDSSVPLVVDLTADWSPGCGWHNLTANRVALDEGEQKRRGARRSASEDFLDTLENDFDR